MSKPDIVPKTTVSGISVDPRTLERVIPQSRRQDGTVRPERKVRPGFTPQEDVQRFRGSRQAQVAANALPKGHIVGWVPPSSAGAQAKATAGLSKSAKKNAKRKEKRQNEVAEKIKDSWEDDDDDDEPPAEDKKEKEKAKKTPPKTAVAESSAAAQANDLADKLEKLDVQ